MDYAERQTDIEIAKVEKHLAEVYGKSANELQAKANEYFSKFAERYEKEYDAFLQGKYTAQEFKMWYYTQVGRGEHWQMLKTDAAQKMVSVNQEAAKYINGFAPGIYSLNANFTAYEIEKKSGIAFNLVNEDVVRELALDKNHSEFRVLSVNPKRDYEWNQKRIQNELLSGILQGKSVDRLADGFLNVMGSNKGAAIRNARTALTSAQNAGRQNTFNRAEELGIEVEKEWIATADNRTRDSHKRLDGVIVKNNEEFPNGLMYPGDPDGEPEEVYNCRCSVRAILPKYQGANRTNNTAAEYKKWVEEKENSKNYTVTLQKETNGGSVKKADSYTYNGITYVFDGRNVKFDYTEREEEVAKILARYLNADVTMIPKVDGIYKHIPSPDYQINGINYDLKEIKEDGKDTIYNAVKGGKKQANRFVIDITNFKGEQSKAVDHIQNLFNRKYTDFVEEVVLVNRNDVVATYTKK